MHPIIEEKRPEIIALCSEYGVIKLDLFGAAIGPGWDSETSDFDFVVEFDAYDPGIARRCIRFADALEELLGRDADFAFESRMKPRFRKRVDASREAVLG